MRPQDKGARCKVANFRHMQVMQDIERPLLKRLSQVHKDHQKDFPKELFKVMIYAIK